ncbi:MAG: hypothetical protein JNK82_42440, partial [Myxococcaceae bacterium]|nr:hypothetical protein [Myxococcaceae bacterium]
MTYTLWSVARSTTLLLTFAMLPLPIVAAYMGSPSDVRCEHAGERVNCMVTDGWPLAAPGRLVSVRGAERVEVVKKRLMIVSPEGDLELRVPRSNEIVEADLTAAAQRLTALVRDPT